MKKLLPVWALTIMGCMSLTEVLARPAMPSHGAAITIASPVRASYQYRIYRDNGQYIGTCTVNKPAELASYASKLGPGSYLFVGVEGTPASAERRIIVYQTSLTADRRIIVY